MANSNGYKFYAGLKGSNVLTVGAEDSVFNFTDLASAVAAANPKDLIMVYPGTYTQTTILTINKDLTVIGIGGVVVTSAIVTTGATVTLNVPASHDAAVAINFENITFVNTSTGSAIQSDNNGGCLQNLTINLKDCSILNTSTGFAYESKQSAATKDIFLNITGSPVLHVIGKSSFAKVKALSVTTIVGMQCNGAFALGTTAVASTFNMIKCVYASAAQTAGGDAAQIQNYVGNMFGASLLAAALTKGDDADFDATGTEAAILYA